MNVFEIVIRRFKNANRKTEMICIPGLFNFNRLTGLTC